MTPIVCDKCGSPNMSTSSFCARCGAPLASARRTRKERKRPLFLLSALMWLLGLFPGLVRPKVVILFVLAMPTAAGLGYLGMFLLRLGGIFSGPAIAAFGLVTYWTAWAWMFYGDTCFPSEALADFDGTHWLLMLLVTVTPIAIAALALGL